MTAPTAAPPARPVAAPPIAPPTMAPPIAPPSASCATAVNGIVAAVNASNAATPIFRIMIPLPGGFKVVATVLALSDFENVALGGRQSKFPEKSPITLAHNQKWAAVVPDAGCLICWRYLLELWLDQPAHWKRRHNLHSPVPRKLHGAANRNFAASCFANLPCWICSFFLQSSN